MSFYYERSYRGPVQLCVFDWAGTTVDYGCMAPAGAFRALFLRHGVEATEEQARGPMGMHKRDHIATMLQVPALARQWVDQHGKPHTDDDVEALFQEFIPMQLEALPPYAKVIPGVVEVTKALRAQGIKLGGTTGYNEAMMNICRDAAREAGYDPDVSICNTMVPKGRPAPWMAVQCAQELNIYPFESIVKVGDTVTDIQEGLNAGMWTVGITRTGNEVGLAEADLNALPEAEQEARIRRADDKLRGAGAHYVIEGVSDLLPVVEEIGLRLSQGERP